MNIENKIILELAQSDHDYGLFYKNRNLKKNTCHLQKIQNQFS